MLEKDTITPLSLVNELLNHEELVASLLVRQQILVLVVVHHLLGSVLVQLIFEVFHLSLQVLISFVVLLELASEVLPLKLLCMTLLVELGFE